MHCKDRHGHRDSENGSLVEGHSHADPRSDLQQGHSSTGVRGIRQKDETTTTAAGLQSGQRISEAE